MTTQKRALVLGGGGVAGIAWQTGVVVGLADEGLDLRDAGLLLGTSAGANVAAQLASGLGLEELFARQTDPALQAREIMARVDLQGMIAALTAVVRGAAGAGEALRRMGGWARDRSPVTVAERRAVIASRLPVHDWPQQRLLVVAVDADSGERVTFDRSSGVPLVDAVAASSAVPGIWPPVPIGGHLYIDGGAHSFDNADLASGAERVVVLSPEPTPFPWSSLEGNLARLREAGAQIEVVAADAGLREVLAAVGNNPLDPGARAPAAQHGRVQGRALAARLSALWR
jgi:NTE family protein